MRTCGALISVISDYQYKVLRNTLINAKHDQFSYLIKEVKVNSLLKFYQLEQMVGGIRFELTTPTVSR